jgi:glycosyltransferase involved in cell wall biosynthesis
VRIAGVDVECHQWQLSREVEHFQELDIGLYPLEETDEFARAKHGFKMHMYMSVGVPPVASATGLNAQVAGGENALLARNADDWGRHLATLLRDEALRHQMGANGRAEVVREWSLHAHVDRWAEILRAASDSRAARTHEGVLDIRERSA